MSHPIKYFNRYTQQIETEKVYGDSFLKFFYANPLGKLPLNTLIRRPWFSKFYGYLMNRPSSKTKVLPFINNFHVNVQEFTQPPETFNTFNEFFYRKLKPKARPILKDPKTIVFPADGRHFGFQNLSKTDTIFAKGQKFSLNQLLQSKEEAQKYHQGSIVISRLCPTDYHRFHYPASGITSSPILINGPLYSVNPIALRKNIQYLFQNKRYKTTIKTQNFGDILMLEIGATCVGSIIQNNPNPTKTSKGNEKGYFQFGGSSTILIFEPGKIQLAPDLIEHSQFTRELYARMGDFLGALA